MKTFTQKISLLAAVLIIVGLAFIAWLKTDQGRQNNSNAGVGNTTLAEVLLPKTLSQSAQIGKRAFGAKCVACHGIKYTSRVITGMKAFKEPPVSVFAPITGLLGICQLSRALLAPM